MTPFPSTPFYPFPTSFLSHPPPPLATPPSCSSPISSPPHTPPSLFPPLPFFPPHPPSLSPQPPPPTHAHLPLLPSTPRPSHLPTPLRNSSLPSSKNTLSSPSLFRLLPILLLPPLLHSALPLPPPFTLPYLDHSLPSGTTAHSHSYHPIDPEFSNPPLTPFFPLSPSPLLRDEPHLECFKLLPLFAKLPILFLSAPTSYSPPSTPTTPLLAHHL